ncbi:ABC transporter permease [Shimazuella kribbensis]|uniref:ABC transporter permease n=1 Tax=Shimazuella kribbensis TaxID=139808 RepID=UPI00041C10FB|nr:ABC transporter permease [Shimazuella kribbensis]
MKAYLQLVKAQLLLFARNKNSFIWSLLLPVFMMIALGTLLGGDNEQFALEVSIIDRDNSVSSKELVQALKKAPGVTTVDQSEKNALASLKKNELQMVIVVPRGFGTAMASKTEKAVVTVYQDQGNLSTSKIGTAIVAGTIDEINKKIVNFQPRIDIKEKGISTHQLKYMDFLVPGILALLIMSNNLNGVAAQIASWRERSILRRMQGTPLSSGTFIAGQMTARILINVVQAFVVILIAHFIFGVNVYGSWGTLLFFVLLGTLTFMSIGFIVASLAKTPESASPIAGLISFPMMFIGGIFFPVRQLPDFLQIVVQAIPIGHLTTALRGVMNNGATFATLQVPLWILLTWFIVSFTVAALTFRWDVK